MLDSPEALFDFHYQVRHFLMQMPFKDNNTWHLFFFFYDYHTFTYPGLCRYGDISHLTDCISPTLRWWWWWWKFINQTR